MSSWEGCGVATPAINSIVLHSVSVLLTLRVKELSSVRGASSYELVYYVMMVLHHMSHFSFV